MPPRRQRVTAIADTTADTGRLTVMIRSCGPERRCTTLRARVATALAVTLTLTIDAASQSAPPLPSSGDVQAAAKTPPDTRVVAPAPMPPTIEEAMHVRRPWSPDRWRRWLVVSSLAAGTRWRATTSDEGSGSGDLQNSLVGRARLTVDRAERLALHAGVATGRGFAGGWNNTGVGSSAASQPLALKELFIAVRPARSMEVQAGGLFFVRGESTEATSYDNDGSIVGQRVVLQQPLVRLVDELTITRAYLGDLGTAAVLPRLDRLDRANYHQVVAGRRYRSHTSVSVEHTWLAGTRVSRAAVTVDTRLRPIADRVRVEHYARWAPDRAQGVALGLQRHIASWSTMTLGWSNIDRRNGGLNGDLIRTGQRLVGSVAVRLAGAWLVSAQVAHAVGAAPVDGPRTRFDGGVVLDLLRAVHPGGH